MESAIASAKKTAMAWNKKSFKADLQFIAKSVLSQIPTR